MKDMHNNIKVIQTHSGANVGTTGAANGTLSAAVDRRGYESAEFIYGRGVSGAATDTITPVLLEGDTTNGSFTSVAAADILGNETVLTGSAAASGRVGYKGNKRYLKTRLYGVGTATARVNGHIVLGHPNLAPVAT